MTNYRTCSFRILISIIAINLIIIYLLSGTVNHITEPLANIIDNNYDKFLVVLMYSGIIANVLLLLGVIITIASVVKKEPKDFQFVISIIGYLLLIIGSVYFGS